MNKTMTLNIGRLDFFPGVKLVWFHTILFHGYIQVGAKHTAGKNVKDGIETYHPQASTKKQEVSKTGSDFEFAFKY